MKVFVSGLIDKATRSDIKRFEYMVNYLRSQGHVVISELDLNFPEVSRSSQEIIDETDKDKKLVDWLLFLVYCQTMLIKCDALFLVYKWEESRSSCILYDVVEKLGMKIIEDNGDTLPLANENEMKAWFERKINN
jgi:hypothetical protein